MVDSKVDTKAGEKFITTEQIGSEELVNQLYEWATNQLKSEIDRLEKQDVSPIEI